MRLARFALLPVIAVVAAACSSGSGNTAAPARTGSASSAGPTAGAPSAATVTHLEVELTDGLRIEPAEITVPSGVPVTFVVTNASALEHEFYLGDEEAQAQHEKDMVEMGGMGHDEPEGIAVKPGETKELTYTFAPGETLAGCHVAGHYGGGMRATITVTG